MLELNKIHCIDVLQGLKQLDNESIDCCVTSPPYWALRDYKLEPTIWDDEESCEHNWDADFEGGIVLDPFMGAGTTSVVARRLGRQFIGFELNNDYITIAYKRLNKIEQPLTIYQNATNP